MTKPQIRTLSRLLGVFHNTTYYAKELKVFRDHGIPDFWDSYMAFRSAPMGTVTAPVISATFYNFAPVMIEAAIPAVWDQVTPDQALDLRNKAIETALTTVFASNPVDDTAVSAATTVRQALADMSDSGRALFGAHRLLPLPDQPLMQLWHAATLWREYRGDGHNIALAAEGIDGIECHVLLAGKGVANRKVIEQIRGWDADSWDGAQRRLTERALVDNSGMLTDSGAALRHHIESVTDRLASGPLDVIGPEPAATLITQLEPVVAHLIESGVVPGRWPPPKLDMP